MLRVIGLLLVLWLAISLIGAIIKGLFWLALLGGLLFVATAALGWTKRDRKTLPRGW
ncbi:hypothetical protein [Blastococcus sp. TF02A-30]|uniref:hypothetical protein n=1 Tax=Blastococcus sp. TF02A-30 TaxID=2250580 RepID=UPI0018F3409F|nr:hypothetical protein [Blastococcus sp. TF02A-30]